MGTKWCEPAISWICRSSSSIPHKLQSTKNTSCSKKVIVWMLSGHTALNNSFTHWLLHLEEGESVTRHAYWMFGDIPLDISLLNHLGRNNEYLRMQYRLSTSHCCRVSVQCTSASFFAEISVKSPWKFFIFINSKNILRIKVSKKTFHLISKTEALYCTHHSRCLLMSCNLSMPRQNFKLSWDHSSKVQWLLFLR